MERFQLSDKQAQAILEMRLRRLTALERDKIEEELNEIMQYIEYLNRNREPVHKEVIYFETEQNDVQVEVALQHTTAYSENIQRSKE